MPYFVLAGIIECPLFNHARYVADYLSVHLPHFQVTILEKNTGEWKKWLKALNLKNKWYHDGSVIVWKELTMRGGKPYLIGGLSEFWEYCYDYYGLETFLSHNELQKLNKGFQQISIEFCIKEYFPKQYNYNRFDTSARTLELYQVSDLPRLCRFDTSAKTLELLRKKADHSTTLALGHWNYIKFPAFHDFVASTPTPRLWNSSYFPSEFHRSMKINRCLYVLLQSPSYASLATLNSMNIKRYLHVLLLPPSYDELPTLSSMNISRYLHLDSLSYKKQNIDKFPSKQKIVCIIGEDIKMEALLVMQLLELNEVFKDGLKIRIYDKSNYDENMQTMFEEATESMQPEFKFIIEVVNDLEYGLKDCELLIITGNITRKTNEEFYEWLNRNYLYMMQLSEQLNVHAENYLKILLAMHGPVCFNANVLQETLTKVHLYNIVAVTADLGLEVLDAVSSLTNIPLEYLSAPPVWGFIGANQIIDIDRIIQKCNVYLPNSRAAKDISGTTLLLGKYKCELRFLSYALNNIENIWSKIYTEKQIISEGIERPHNFPKIRAIISLIKNWYSSIENGNIISLGIRSNGTFGIPQGIVFSQPVCMNNGKWVPMKAFPPPRKDPCIVEDFIPFIYHILKLFKLRDVHE